MRFDSNRAWKEATSAVKASREVLLALAGAFYMLPSLIVAIFQPAPEPPAGLEGEAAMNFAMQYYLDAAPWLFVAALIQWLGIMAMLTLFTDRRRPTVGEAIREGAVGLVAYVAAMLVLGFGMTLVAALLLGVLGATGVAALVALGVVLLVVGFLYVWVKSSLTAPVVAVEKERNPIRALRRSWALTKGNSVRLALFYLLLSVALFFVVVIAMIVVGVILTVTVGTDGARIPAAVISSALGAVAVTYFAAILAAVHRQLSGPSPQAVSATFE